MQQPIVRRSGLTFLFQSWAHYIQANELEMTLLPEQESAPLLTDTHLYNQMFCCSADMQEITTYSGYNRVVRGVSAFLDRRWGVVEASRSTLLLLWNVLIFFTVLLLFVENLFVILILIWTYSHEIVVIFNDQAKAVVMMAFIIDMLLVRSRVSFEIRGRRMLTHL
jgi:hypothetical protein